MSDVASFDLDRQVDTLRALAWQEHRIHGGHPCRIREQQPLRTFLRSLLQGEPRHLALRRSGYSESNVDSWMRRGRDGDGEVYVRFRQAVIDAQALGRHVRAMKRARRREAILHNPPGRPLRWGPLLPSQREAACPGGSRPADGALGAGDRVPPSGMCAPSVSGPTDPAGLEADRLAAEARTMAAREQRVSQLSMDLFHSLNRLGMPLSVHERATETARGDQLRGELDALLRSLAPATETLAAREVRYRRWRHLTHRGGLTDTEWHLVRARHFSGDGFV